MAKIQLGLAPTSVKLRVKLMNSSVTTGAGLTGLTNTSSGLVISTIQLVEGANGEASASVYTVAASNVETITTLGTYAAPSSNKCRFKEVDATNHPGVYELQFADARFSATGDATKAMTLLISISGATNLAQADIEIECRNQAVNVIQAGGTAWGSGAITDGVFAAATYPKSLRTATAQAGASGSITLDSGASATNDLYVGCSIKIVSGTGAGQSRTIMLYVGSSKVAYVDRVWATNPANDSVFVINAGKLTADINNVGIATAGGATTITLASTAVATNEYYDGAIVQIISGTGVGQSRIIGNYVGATRVATVTDAWGTNPDNTSVYMVRGLGDVEVGINNDKTGYALSASQTFNMTGNITGNVSGSVGSVTGAVGSVTGNVGGNVTGSVGSVTGNVGGNVTGSVGSVAANGISDASFAASTDTKALRTATAQAGSGTGSIVLDAGASATDDLYRGDAVKIVSGTGAGQSRTIVLYVGSSKTAYVDRLWATTPDNTSVFIITKGQLDPELSHSGIAAAGTGGTITLASSASSVNNFYDGAEITIVSGQGVGQARCVGEYDGATKICSMTDGWAVTPNNTSVYIIRSYGDVVTGGFSSGASTTIATQAGVGVLATPANKLSTDATGAALSDVSKINNSSAAAVQLARSSETIVNGTVDVVDFTPTTTQFETADLTNPAADFYKTRTVIFTSGTLDNQAREITASSYNGGTGKTRLTVAALTAAPATGVGFNIV